MFSWRAANLTILCGEWCEVSCPIGDGLFVMWTPKPPLGGCCLISGLFRICRFLAYFSVFMSSPIIGNRARSEMFFRAVTCVPKLLLGEAWLMSGLRLLDKA